MARIELLQRDCTEALAEMEAGSVDIVITSPPYNLGIRYASYRDDGGRSGYLQWARSWGEQLRRLLKPGGSFFLNLGASPASPLLPHQMALLMSELFNLQNTLHWIKSIALTRPSGETIAAGHFKPLNSSRYLSDCHEYLFHFTPQGCTPLDRLAVGVPYADKSNIRRWQHTGGRDLRCRGNTWFIPYRTIRQRASERPHPATFPVELAAMCLKLHGVDARSLVLDPFVGLGSSAVAARECGAGHFIGFDIDAGYLASAQERLERGLALISPGV